MPNEEIRIIVDDNCNISTVPLYPRHHRNEYLSWRSHDTEKFSIDFAESPFEDGETHFEAIQHGATRQDLIKHDLIIGNTPCTSGGGRCREFKYTITAQLPNWPEPCISDPKVIIDDGSGIMSDLLANRAVLALAIGAGLTLLGFGVSQLIRGRD